jgi:diamine N-acetyltransferase
VIELHTIDDTNRAAVEALHAGPAEGRFVSSVVDSMLEAAEEPDGLPVYWAVYSGETPVGFVMITDGVPANPDYFPHFLWKLLIDERFQRQGFGRATLDAVVEHMRSRGADVVPTSAGEGEGSPIPFYERYGFENTGQIVFGHEVLVRLQL